MFPRDTKSGVTLNYQSLKLNKDLRVGTSYKYKILGTVYVELFTIYCHFNK